MLETIKAAAIRLGRVLLAQVIGYLVNIAVPIPYLGITVGAVINAIAKLLRDKLKWEWLPV